MRGRELRTSATRFLLTQRGQSAPLEREPCAFIASITAGSKREGGAKKPGDSGWGEADLAKLGSGVQVGLPSGKVTPLPAVGVIAFDVFFGKVCTAKLDRPLRLTLRSGLRQRTRVRRSLWAPGAGVAFPVSQFSPSIEPFPLSLPLDSPLTQSRYPLAPRRRAPSSSTRACSPPLSLSLHSLLVSSSPKCLSSPFFSAFRHAFDQVLPRRVRPRGSRHLPRCPGDPRPG